MMAVKSAWLWGIGLVLLFAAGRDAPAMAAEKSETAAQPAVFEMREISTLEKNDLVRDGGLTRGAYAACSETPDKQVKAYPKLTSPHPLYGVLRYNCDFAAGKADEIHFVLDASGEASDVSNEDASKTDAAKDEAGKDAAGKDEADKNKTKKTAAPGNKLSRYDRLYIDVNHDLDLTNDPVIKPMSNPPWQALPSWQVDERQAFEAFDLPIDYGPEVGSRPLRILPWLTVSKNADDGMVLNTMHFVVTTARQGRLRIGDREFDAVLGQPYGISGRLDGGRTYLYLKPSDGKPPLEDGGFAGEVLGTLHQIDDVFYTTTATPLGDKITVAPYQGDWGVLRVGAGGRGFEKMGLRGSVNSLSMSVSLKRRSPTDGKDDRPEPDCAREFLLPVGDYLPGYITVRYDNLRIDVSDNYHADGQVQNFLRPRKYFMHIQKGKPFTLDFTSKPEVLFASPAKDTTVKLGGEVNVKAVLIDPKHDIMIRELIDTSRKKKETVKQPDGTERSVERDWSLDPTVTITNSRGQTVAEGTLPFG